MLSQVAYHLQFPRPGPCARATPAYPVRPEGRSSSPRIFLHLSSSVIRTDTAPRTVLGAIVTHNLYCNSQCGYVPCHTIPVGHKTQALHLTRCTPPTAELSRSPGT